MGRECGQLLLTLQACMVAVHTHPQGGQIPVGESSVMRHLFSPCSLTNALSTHA